ncbi:MAG TPA: gliding motility-associated ABC transporter substrate-binding protein GldG [Bacteroidales bacterium]|jgi:ABC-2 type transport system permease protein|nr:gliding motility-associated ABC transporter substrate-binding protein GldG [Bacteroidales bacterium]HOC40142.1 gliding motility-associated ABC transporter substrate-binding protein GldG [Bacteroidales bacterium]HOH93572.1 gliding motility-associated ABC transporter substrate-binding protein GldG [Bacteroidales bacterium]HPM39645.1 gliding motility-associated ABC transporter substrate-binding protein GldG [Bacteroidales bacterium]HQE77988.1 gliding motility-associated ABC transporter substrat
MKNKKNVFKNNKWNLAIVILGLIAINIIASFLYFRIDLTSEKRYSLSPATKNVLKNLDDYVYFQVFLDGNLSPSYKRLQKTIIETLDEFKAYNKRLIKYDLIDPAKGKDEATLRNYLKELEYRGLVPSIDYEMSETGTSENVVWPCAIVTYKGREIPINFIYSNIPGSKEELINDAIENTEYKLIDGIYRITLQEKSKVAFIKGHGELDVLEINDLALALQDYYIVSQIPINHQLKALDEYKAIIIAAPDSTFDEMDKFIIDQYIMKGGRVLWLIDGALADMDSLQSKSDILAIPNDINLDDMLFNYGARVNKDLVMDYHSAQIPVKTGQVGNQPQFSLFNWYFFPTVANIKGHPIVRNINDIKFEFASSIDTIAKPGIRKTILLSSGNYSRLLNTPSIISLNFLRIKADRSFFNRSNIPMAVLLEGSFTSLYKDRIPDTIAKDPDIRFTETSKPNRMIIIGDGNVAKNQVVFRQGKYIPYPLGYDRYTGIMYGNREFLLNCVNYLLDEADIISIRNRDINIRLLDKRKVEINLAIIRTINIVVPILLVCLAGVIIYFFRKRSYK